jgi:hypothetical protein
MADFTQLVTLLATLSVAVERVVEIIKGMVPFLGKQLDPGPAENRRRALLQALAVVCGAVAAYMAQGQIVKIDAAKWLVAPDLHYAGFLIFGFLTAGGSAFWNHILDIIGALKTQKENTAKATAPVAAPAPAQPAAPAIAAAAAAGVAPAAGNIQAPR